MRERATKKCPECGTAANSNVQPECYSCGHVFVKKGKKEKKIKRSATPEARPETKLNGRTAVDKGNEIHSTVKAPEAFLFSVTSADSNILSLLTLKKNDLEQELAAIDTTLSTIRNCCMESGQ